MYYRPNDARDYASQYYEDYNLDEYPNLNKIGGDCANFVSQCIYIMRENKWMKSGI